MDKHTALVLYTGMMTDTGSFRYSNTSSLTFKVVAELLKFKINVAEVYRQTYENIPSQDIKLLLKFLSGIKFFSQGRIVVFQFDDQLRGSKKTGVDLADYVLSFGRAIRGVEVVVLLKKNLAFRSCVWVNLRSQGRVDVN